MRYLLKLNGFKFTSALLLAFFIILVVFSFSMDNKRYTFQTVYDKIMELDAKHNATFRTEVIPSRVLREERIAPLIDDLESLREEIASSSAGNKDAFVMLVDARILMLKAEAEALKANNLGAKARVDYGVDCNNKDKLKEGALLFNSTANYGSKALNYLDKLLTENPESKALIGADDNKILFYESNLGYYRRLSYANVVKFREECGEELMA